MRVMDVVLAVPDIIFALVVVAILGPGDWNTLIAIAIVSIPAFARLTRASTLSLRGLDYVRAERAMGASDADIIVRTILPNSVGPIIVQLVITASLAILIEAGLSFLGLGTQPPAPSWGAMLQTSRSYLSQDPWYGLFPGIALAVTIGALDSLGNGLQVVLGGRSTTAKKPASVG
jgi:peptide/nickel transport system permease protein